MIAFNEWTILGILSLNLQESMKLVWKCVVMSIVTECIYLLIVAYMYMYFIFAPR